MTAIVALFLSILHRTDGYAQKSQDYKQYIEKSVTISAWWHPQCLAQAGATATAFLYEGQHSGTVPCSLYKSDQCLRMLPVSAQTQ